METVIVLGALLLLLRIVKRGPADLYRQLIWGTHVAHRDLPSKDPIETSQDFKVVWWLEGLEKVHARRGAIPNVT